MKKQVLRLRCFSLAVLLTAACKPTLNVSQVDALPRFNADALLTLVKGEHPNGFIASVGEMLNKDKDVAEGVLRPREIVIPGDAIGRTGSYSTPGLFKLQKAFYRMSEYSGDMAASISEAIKAPSSVVDKSGVAKTRAWVTADMAYRRFIKEIDSLSKFHKARLQAQGMPDMQAEIVANEIKNQSMIGMMFESWSKIKAEEAKTRLRGKDFFASHGGGCSALQVNPLRGLALAVLGTAVAIGSYEYFIHTHYTAEETSTSKIPEDAELIRTNLDAVTQGMEDGGPDPVSTVYRAPLIKDLFDMDAVPNAENPTQLAPILYASDDVLPVFHLESATANLAGTPVTADMLGGLNIIGREMADDGKTTLPDILKKMRDFADTGLKNMSKLAAEHGLTRFDPFQNRLNSVHSTAAMLNNDFTVQDNSINVRGCGTANSYAELEDLLHRNNSECLTGLMVQARLKSSND